MSNNNSDEKNIEMIQDEIVKSGFEQAALKFSISESASFKGELGWVNARSLSKNIYDIILKMEIGEISRPVKRDNKILFFKLNDKKIMTSSDIDKNKLKLNLINQKKNYLFNLYSRSYLSKLRNTSFIEYK